MLEIIYPQAPIMPMNRQKQLQEDTHYRVLSLLERQPDMSQREMAEALGVSLGRVNYCLRAMVARGLVSMANFKKRDNKLYLLTPAGIAEKVALTTQFLQRKLEEYDALKAEIEALQQQLQAAATDKPGNGH